MISQADLETHLGLDVGTDTALLTGIEASAAAFVERYTHRYFGASDEITETLTGTGGRRLFLPEPATDVASVHEQAYPGATQTQIVEGDDDGFEIRDAVLHRKGARVWVRGYEYVVVFTRGYTENDAGPPADIAAPEDIKGVVKDLVALRYHQAKDGSFGKSTESIGDYSVGFRASQAFTDGDLKQLPQAYQTLQSWRRKYV